MRSLPVGFLWGRRRIIGTILRGRSDSKRKDRNCRSDAPDSRRLGDAQNIRIRPAAVMAGLVPGLEPGIQAAPSMIILRTSTLDTRVKPRMTRLNMELSYLGVASALPLAPSTVCRGALLRLVDVGLQWPSARKPHSSSFRPSLALSRSDFSPLMTSISLCPFWTADPTRPNPLFAK
jgi:hypothetical protein